MLKLNLQQFAEDQDDIDNDDHDFEDDEFELDTDDSDDDDSDSDDDSDDTDSDNDNDDSDDNDNDSDSDDDDQDDKNEKTVPLKAIEAERKKWQSRLNDPVLKKKLALADRLAAMSGTSLDALYDQMEQMEVQRHIDQGVNPQMAEAFVRGQKEISDAKKLLNKQTMDLEIKNLKSDPFFSDVDDYREELEEYADRTGLTIEQTYMAIRGKERVKEMQTEIEQRTLNNINKKQSKKLDTTTNGEGKTKTKVKLSKEQLDMAKAAKMTPQEYYAMTKIENADQYKKMKNKGKKK